MYKKKKIQKMNEGGNYMSSKIFQKSVLKKLNINQVLFILNRKNWDQDVNKFAKNFKRYKNADDIDSEEDVDSEEDEENGGKKNTPQEIIKSLSGLIIDFLKELKLEMSDIETEITENNLHLQYALMSYDLKVSEYV